MGTRSYTFTIPLSRDTSYELLLKAGKQLPDSSELAGLQFGRWENTISDRDAGCLEWIMYDHKIPTNKIYATLVKERPAQTSATFKVTIIGQILDPMGVYKETLRILLDPYLELIKQEITQSSE